MLNLFKKREKEKAADKVPEAAPLEMKLLRFGKWRFHYNSEEVLYCSDYDFILDEKIMKPDFYKEELVCKYEEDIAKYRDAQGNEVLVLWESIPTFDSGDRQYDSYKELYLFVKQGKLQALFIKGGYCLGKAVFYPQLTCADSETQKLLQDAGVL